MAKAGTLEVICGPMFCGKTEELIRRVQRAQIAGKKVQVFNHKLDERYGKDIVATHDGVKLDATAVSKTSQILKKLDPKAAIVAIDEAQWFGEELVEVVEKLLRKGKKVIVAGLTTTYEGEPFEPIPTLMSIADRASKLTAICTRCGEEAIFHKKVRGKTEGNPQETHVSLAGAAQYEARCRSCFFKKEPSAALKPRFRCIAVSGYIASGSTTLARLLSEKLGWEMLSVGEELRKFFAEKGWEIADVDHMTPQMDKEIEARMRKLVKTGKNIIYEAHLAGWNTRDLPHVLRVLCRASQEVQLKRFVRREGMTREEALRLMRRRHRALTKKYKRQYGIKDRFDPKYFHLVFDTGEMTPEEESEEVVRYLFSKELEGKKV